MTVVFRKEADQRFTLEEVMWSRPELVKAIVRNALVGQTEATIDMTLDMQASMEAEELTRNGLQNLMHNVKDSTEDFLEDLMSDLRREVLKALAEANYGAIVTGIKYDLAGEITDIEVDISVS
jgi:hypothetical protein